MSAHSFPANTPQRTELSRSGNRYMQNGLTKKLSIVSAAPNSKIIFRIVLYAEVIHELFLVRC